MKKLLFTIVGALFIFHLCAQPAINNVEGSVLHGYIISLEGNDFGTKPAGTPLIWDDFENGANGELAGNGWVPQRDNETHPIYTNEQKYGRGNLSLTNHIEPNSNNAPGCQFCGAYQEVEGSYELYTSYRFRFDVTGNDYAIIKLARLASTPNYDGVDHYNGVGTFKYQYQPMNDWGYINLEYSSDANIQETTDKVPGGEWHRVEMYYRMSQPAGESNGEAWIMIDNEKDSGFRIKDAVTLAEGYESKLHSLLLPLMLANPKEDGKWDLYVDDVYLDNSRARVELGNASTWSSSTHREIQTPSFWSYDSIAVTVNLGMFEDGEQTYLYVVDKYGNVNENGFPVALVAGASGQSSNTEFKIYPNPATDKIYIQGLSTKAEVSVRDLSGKREIKYLINNPAKKNNVIDISDLPKGIYLIEIQTSKDRYSKKIVKHK